MRFPILFSQLEEIYKKYDKDFTSCHWQITCSKERNNKNLSQLLSDNALAVFGYDNTLFIEVPRYGIDVGVNTDTYKHNKLYYGDVSDLKEKWRAFSGEVIDELYMTIYDKSGVPLHKWEFHKCLVRPALERVFDLTNGSGNKEGEYLYIPILIDKTKPEKSISLTKEKK